MKNIKYRIISTLLIIVMLFGMIVFDATTSVMSTKAMAVSGTVDLSTQPMSAVQSMLNNATAGDTITVTGSATVSTAYVFNISNGVTVNWQAAIIGAVNPSTAFMLTINGSGTFNVIGSGSINNTGTGGTVNIAGTGTTLNVRSGGEISAERSGSAVNIAAANVKLNVESNSNITNTGTTSAVNVMTQLANVEIVVDGGSIISVPNGNAINDSGGDTHITVTNGGTVTSGAARAIWLQGMDSLSTVMVESGVVANAAGNNLNPAIDVSGVRGNLLGGGWNVVVQGTGVVRSTSLTGFALQTRGNVLVEDNAQVISINGRAINLVGADSQATIRGSGSVSAIGTGTAISTATTNPQELPNTGVIVDGGTVSAVSGNAINITGVNSKVLVTGGMVSSISGNAINADTGLVLGNPASNPYASFNIIVAGGSVSSNTGYAIQNLGGGPSSKVIVSDTASGTGGYGKAGGQVSVLHTGAAIRAPSGTVTVNGGFVFAYGTTVTTAISAQNINWPTSSPSGGQVAVWNQAAAIAAGRTHYEQSSFVDLAIRVGSFPTNLQWYFNPKIGSGLYYSNGITAGFFLLSEVVVSNDYAIIFDSATGIMYKDINSNGIITPGAIVTAGKAPLGTAQELGAWWATPRSSGGGYDLHLSGFSWTTHGVDRALTIMKSGGTHNEVNIYLNGISVFDSQHVGGTGITIGNNLIVNINGSGTLIARGSRDNGVGLALSDPSNLVMAFSEFEEFEEMGETEGADEIAEVDEIDENAVQSDVIEEDNGNVADDTLGEASNGDFAEENVEYYKYIVNSFDATDVRADDATDIDAGATDVRAVDAEDDDDAKDEPPELVVLEEISDEITVFATSSYGSVTITNGEFIAQGGLRAVNWPEIYDTPPMTELPTNTVIIPPIGVNYRWQWNQSFDGSGVGDSGSNDTADFVFVYTDKFVRLSALRTANLISAAQIGGVSDLADSVAIELCFDVAISDLNINDVAFHNMSGAATRGATLTGSGTTWIVWLDGVQAQGTIEIIISSQVVGFFVKDNVAPTEVYKETSFDLIVTSIVGGTTEGHGTGWYQIGFPIGVTAIAESGYHFVGWTVEGVELDEGSLANYATFAMPKNNVNILANFAANPPDTYTLNVLGSDGGVVDGTSSGAYSEGYAVEVRAIANDGYHFVGWAIEGAELNDGVESMLATFDMPANDVTLVALFEENPFGQYTLNVLCSSGGTVSGTASGAYEMDYHVSVVATPNEGYSFTGWTVEGENVEIDGGLLAINAQFSMPANIVTITANFTALDVVEDDDVNENNNEVSPVERSPQTGVEHNVIIPLALLFVGAAAIVTAERYRKQQKR